jgi:ATP-binding cassette subfamily F protein 3
VNRTNGGSEPAAGKDNGNDEISFEERKNINKNISRLEKAVGSAEEAITRLEGILAVMNSQLARPETIASEDFFGEYEQVKKELSSTMAEWEQLHEELELWTSKKTW